MELHATKMGDFYEFEGRENAQTVATLLGRMVDRSPKAQDGMTCGVPYHAIWEAKETLEAAGHTVVISYM